MIKKLCLDQPRALIGLHNDTLSNELPNSEICINVTSCRKFRHHPLDGQIKDRAQYYINRYGFDSVVLDAVID